MSRDDFTFSNIVFCFSKKAPLSSASNALTSKVAFKGQIETDLRPVLRDRDFVAFDFEQAWSQLERVAGMVKGCFGE